MNLRHIETKPSPTFDVHAMPLPGRPPSAPASGFSGLPSNVIEAQ